MKTAAIIGGLGPESTIEYYRLILARHRERMPEASAPSIFVNSIDMKKVLELAAQNPPALAAYLLDEVERLANAGASFGAIAANTPHIVFDKLQQQSPIKLISIVEAACDAARTLGLNRLGLFGTNFTMRGRFYFDVFSRRGIELVVPGIAEQDYIHEKYLTELVARDIRSETREQLIKIVAALKQRSQIQGLILGGTELSLIFTEREVCGIPVLDTTRIHVEAIVEKLIAFDEKS